MFSLPTDIFYHFKNNEKCLEFSLIKLFNFAPPSTKIFIPIIDSVDFRAQVIAISEIEADLLLALLKENCARVYLCVINRKLHNLINFFQLIIKQNNFSDATNFFNQFKNAIKKF